MERESHPSEDVPIEVLPASPEDAEAIVRIQADSWLATYPNEAYGITREDIEASHLGSPRRAAHWRAQIEQRLADEIVCVAKANNRVIGYCSAERGEAEHYIHTLYLDPAWQGKGVGRALTERMLAWLGTDKPVALGVAVYNANAIAFYRKMGFEESDELPEPAPPLPSGRVLPIVKMVRPAGA